MNSPINISGWGKRKAWIKDYDADGDISIEAVENIN